MSPSNPDFNPLSTDSVLSTILTKVDGLKDTLVALDGKIVLGQLDTGKRLGALETFKDGIKGQHRLVIGISVVAGGVIPAAAFLWSLFPHK